MTTKRDHFIAQNLRWHFIKMSELEVQGLAHDEASKKAFDWLMAYRKGTQWAVNEAPKDL